jgi:hypothetical protein
MMVILPKSWHPGQIDDGEKRSIAFVPGRWRERHRRRRRAASATTSRGQPVVDVRNFFIFVPYFIKYSVHTSIMCISILQPF